MPPEPSTTREVADIVALVSQKTAEEALRSLSSKSAAAGKDKDHANREADVDDISKMQKEVAALRKDKKYANKTLDSVTCAGRSSRSMILLGCRPSAKTPQERPLRPQARQEAQPRHGC